MTSLRPSYASRSYVIPCTAAFRDQVQGLATRRHASVADIARAVLLLVGSAGVAGHDDPGEPVAAERERVVVKSGALEGRALLRKPRLQTRLPGGLSVANIRKALAIALELDQGRLELSVARAGAGAAAERKLEAAAEEGQRLAQMIGALAFDPLAHGVRNRAEALYVLGFPPGAMPDQRTVRERFRQLARVHHPDGAFGDHRRMTQLNEAAALLQRGR
ncbi:MAG: J domain-containing protein [Alphaproteobacteria bacterium]|nr:J domain-containing protein [Alphaproteobacteria bacterium]